MIEIKNLSHHYRVPDGSVIQALHQVNLKIQEGDFIGIAGPNGSGKSTLAKHFNALLIPGSEEGQVLVDGMDTRNYNLVWKIRQRVGMVFSNPDNQIVAPVVEEEVAFGPENLGVETAEIRARVDEVLAQVGMPGFQKRAPHLLSGGQKQRVAIAGALAMQPRYLVLDEPTSMLDPQGRQEVLRTLRNLNDQEGITVILITHNMEELLEVDRLIVIAAGQIIRDASPTQIFREMEGLREHGLDVPEVVKFNGLLRAQGVQIPFDCLTVDSLISFLHS